MNPRILTHRQLQDFQALLRREEKSQATVEKYLRDTRAFSAFVGQEAVTKERVLSYKQQLVAQGYAPGSINSMLASINSLLEMLGWQDCKVKNIRTHGPPIAPSSRS